MIRRQLAYWSNLDSELMAIIVLFRTVPICVLDTEVMSEVELCA